jgi:hypothetical protein
MSEGVIGHSKDLHRPVALTPPATDDVTDQVMMLAINLGVCPKPEEMDPHTGGYRGTGDKVPPSLAIIEAGATQLTKRWALIVAAGGPAISAGAVAGFWNGSTDVLKVAILAASAFVLAGCAIAIAIIISSDLKARSFASGAQYEARAKVAEAYLTAASAANKTAAPPSSHEGAGGSGEAFAFTVEEEVVVMPAVMPASS